MDLASSALSFPDFVLWPTFASRANGGWGGSSITPPEDYRCPLEGDRPPWPMMLIHGLEGSPLSSRQASTLLLIFLSEQRSSIVCLIVGFIWDLKVLRTVRMRSAQEFSPRRSPVRAFVQFRWMQESFHCYQWISKDHLIYNENSCTLPVRKSILSKF